ncbi:MAG TPA: VWA domain-containing protein [Acidobacteriota bacterium]|jgi:VWFA-related protein
MRKGARKFLFLFCPSLLVCFAQSVYHVDVTMVLLEAVVVRSDGSLVKGLTRDKFEVFEDGKPRPLLYFSESPDLPVSLGILIDEGSGMEDAALLEVKRFLFNFVHRLKPHDEILLGAYAGDVRFLTALTSDRLMLTRALDEIYTGKRGSVFENGRWNFSGNSNTGYAVDSLIREMRAAKYPRRVILVFSSTFNNTGEATEEHLRRADMFLYAVAFPNTTSKILSIGGDLKAKSRILQSTAGMNFDFTQDPEFPDKVAGAVQYQYSLGYAFTGEKDISRRRIEVRVTGTDYQVRFRPKLVERR